MKKLPSTFLIATLFFIGGIYLLLSATDIKSNATHISVDYEGTCNDDDYFSLGYSELPDKQVYNPNPSSADLNANKFMLVSHGQTLHSILAVHQISSSEIFSLGEALTPFIRPKDLAPGDLYQLTTRPIDNNQAVIDSLVIKKLDSNRVPISYFIKREKTGFSVTSIPAPISEELSLINVKVSGTLFRSFMSLAFGNELMQRLMSVFNWRMRMPDDVLGGDIIEILVKKRFAENNFIGYGRIEAVYYQQKQRTLFASHFKSSDAKIDGFFDENGHSLEKEFLLSAVYDTVATSERSWRMHPVIKQRIRHNGIDFRGTIGTPFMAIADGEVIEKRYDRNVGNMIRIKHKYGIHSEYFHANSLQEKLAVGSRVKRGQIIGTIGNTGFLCTGPHLHLGIYQMAGEKRKYVDLKQFRKKLVDMPRLSGSSYQEYLSHLTRVKDIIAAKRLELSPTLATK